jgi:hypothetical protein
MGRFRFIQFAPQLLCKFVILFFIVPCWQLLNPVNIDTNIDNQSLTIILPCLFVFLIFVFLCPLYKQS